MHVVNKMYKSWAAEGGRWRQTTGGDYRGRVIVCAMTKLCSSCEKYCHCVSVFWLSLPRSDRHRRCFSLPRNHIPQSNNNRNNLEHNNKSKWGDHCTAPSVRPPALLGPLIDVANVATLTCVHINKICEIAS